MAYRACEGCGKKYRSKQARREEILGEMFFVVLELSDLDGKQRKDVEYRARFCSDECADAMQVEHALRNTDQDCACPWCRARKAIVSAERQLRARVGNGASAAIDARQT